MKYYFIIKLKYEIGLNLWCCEVIEGVCHLGPFRFVKRNNVIIEIELERKRVSVIRKRKKKKRKRNRVLRGEEEYEKVATSVKFP